MIIKNNRPGMITIAYNDKNGVNSMHLKPGFNSDVDAKLFYKIKDINSAVQDMLDDGTIEEASIDKGELEGLDVENPTEPYQLILDNKSLAGAAAEVGLIIDQDQLQKVLKFEKRKSVLAAAKKQLEGIQAPAELRKKDESTQS